ncbi:MAG: hypothetical protein PWP64_370 [Candidatus Cloacimonadota bacterium]|nr:hypothetical protein [Candidatus Cloacimonadota bacterium]
MVEQYKAARAILGVPAEPHFETQNLSKIKTQKQQPATSMIGEVFPKLSVPAFVHWNSYNDNAAIN